MQLIPDASKTAILQPYIGVGKGLIPSSAGIGYIFVQSFLINEQAQPVQ
jgi:hypothetical protein